MSLETLEEMREVFLGAPIPWSTRLLGMVTAFLLLSAVLYLVRRRSLGEEYTPIWVLAAVGTAVVSLWQTPITLLSRAVGAWSHTSTLFFFSQVFLVGLCLFYAVRLSRLTLQVKNLSQEIALLRAEGENRGPGGLGLGSLGPEASPRAPNEASARPSGGDPNARPAARGGLEGDG
ncbi:MAG: DUF2304 domain-containing protein [Acidobacteriota bacterium]